MSQQQAPVSEQQQSESRPVDLMLDEIDIGALFGVLWRGRYLALGMTIVFALAALTYVKLIVNPVYEVKFAIYPVSDSGLRSIQPVQYNDKFTSFNAPDLSAEDMFREFKDRLLSVGWQKQFWLATFSEAREGSFVWMQSKEFIAFSEGYFWLRADENKNLDDRILLESSEPEVASDLFSRYAKFVEIGVVRDLVQKQLVAVHLNVELIDEEIAGRKTKTKNLMDDRFTKVSEALDVAVALGFKKPQLQQLTDVSSTLGNARFLMGSDALIAEKKAIQARRNNDAYVKGLRELQSEQLALTKYAARLERNVSTVSTVNFPGKIEFPVRPSKPNKLLIVVLGIVLGAMFGTVIVFIRHGVRSRNQGE